ncbi:uncharacterized protein [Anoplolepis gracilipes]|uniref:uncharacterized protein n=1 Tax=Anoplolepis gracilipes TaxID=354296 RepID=UPI003B9FB4F1
MATIMFLPQEIIDNILSYNDISIEDIINFRCACKDFRWAAKSDKYCFLKKKFFQRWPNAKRHYDRQLKEKEQYESEKDKQNNERDVTFIETGINYGRQLRNRYIIFELENDINICFLMDEIKNLLVQSPRNGCNLTERYCNMKLYECFTSKRIWQNLKRFEEQSDEEPLFELLSTFFAQRFQLQEDVSYSRIKMSLDNIAQEILNCLRQKYPDHSIFSMPAENFFYWRDNNIYKSYWNKAEGTKILDTLEEYLFGELNFRACSLKHRRYIVTDDPTNLEEIKYYMCINYVLENKYGHELIVLIIYQSVARRLGLHCEILEPESHYFGMRVNWKPSYSTYDSRYVRCFTIKSGTNDLIPQSFDKFMVLNIKMAEYVLEESYDAYNMIYNASLACMNGPNTFKKAQTVR